MIAQFQLSQTPHTLLQIYRFINLHTLDIKGSPKRILLAQTYDDNISQYQIKCRLTYTRKTSHNDNISHNCGQCTECRVPSAECQCYIIKSTAIYTICVVKILFSIRSFKSISNDLHLVLHSHCEQLPFRWPCMNKLCRRKSVV